MTLEQVLEQSKGMRYDYPALFTDDCGLGITIPEKNICFVKSWEGNKRRAVLDINTFKGISYNAIHYYGNIKVQGVRAKLNNGPDGNIFIPLRDIPLAHYTYWLELTRPVTKEDIQGDPEMWEGYKEGDMTRRFNSMEELLSLAKEVFRLRFVGDWEFYVESPYTRYKL